MSATASVHQLRPSRCPSCGRTAKRSTEANKRYWTLLHLLSDNCKPMGVVYSATAWHEYWKQKLLGANEIKLPNGKAMLIANSTADLDRGEFNDYMQKVEAWAAEHGIWLEE